MGVTKQQKARLGDARQDAFARGGHRAGSAIRFRGSGSRSPRASRASRRRSRWGWHPRLALGGSVRLAACDRSAWPRCLAVIYPSLSARRLPSSRRKACGVREIARQTNRSPSTISRELRRNAATRAGSSGYRAINAQWHADRRAKRPKVAKLAANEKLRDYVQDRLSGLISRPDGTAVPGPTVRFIGRRHGRRQDRRWAKAWSPEQISNRLRVDFANDESMRISHEAIYQALYVQGRGALKRELVACLRTGRALRVPQARTAGRGKRFVTPRDHDQPTTRRSR